MLEVNECSINIYFDLFIIDIVFMIDFELLFSNITG